jgi:acyl CoA:acetate/3-ketoacid CoA transferase
VRGFSIRQALSAVRVFLGGVATGIIVGRNVLAPVLCKPKIAGNCRDMDARLFRPAPINLATELAMKAP